MVIYPHRLRTRRSPHTGSPQEQMAMEILRVTEEARLPRAAAPLDGAIQTAFSPPAKPTRQPAELDKSPRFEAMMPGDDHGGPFAGEPPYTSSAFGPPVALALDDETEGPYAAPASTRFKDRRGTRNLAPEQQL
eukprot:TRINITY_DN9432_c0_g1_i1.p2 TRINITY_DN9432_c0_g1~~TRINITY_DN9432_c0_g1_i1.p2  ORF type:complete len:134 (+),score=34.21 TRINITY_DN9432_c0_g1_i1:570-971(+)